MADKDTLNLIKFKFGSFQSIKDLSSKDQSSFYFASDKPAFYNAGLWYGVSSLTSSVNEETGAVTLVINGGFGDNWESSQVEHTFVAGMTTEQKAQLETAYKFAIDIGGTSADDIINKWQEVVDFLAGIEGGTLEGIVATKADKNTTITAGDGLTGGGDLSTNRTIGLGTPSTITDSTINEAKGTTHTHAINKASTEQLGIVRLNNTLTSDNTDQALTANQGRVLKEHIDETVEHIDDMFELIDKGNGVKEIKAKYGLWSDSFISARGVDNESSGVGGLDAQAVWDLLMQNDDATKIINVAHIPDITIAKITDIANASVANADKLDGKHLSDISQEIDAKSNGLDLNTMLSGSALLRTTWDFAHSDKVLNQPWSDSAANAWLLPGNYPLQIARDFYSNDIRVRGHSHYGWTNWKQIAFTDSNVASATKLETPRTIWGQSFDGTNNVGGALYLGANSILGGDNLNILYHSASGYLEVGHGNATAGYSTYIDGNYIYFRYSTEHKTGILLSSNGNVGIGGIVPTAKLHVNGDSIINGKLTVANQLAIGNATLYWDVANQCLRVNAGIASDSFLSAKGIDTTGNGQGGGGGFDTTMLWNELTIPSPTNTGKTIMLDLLPDMPTSKVTDFANQVKALITVENIPTLTSDKISDFNSAVATAMASTLADISNEFTSVNNKITTANTNINSLEERIVAIEQALTWQGVS